MNNHSIDFVVPWLDSTDPEWQKSFQEHQINSGKYEDLTDQRYRDWELFKYWFRGVDKYTPWVNKVHLITNGKYPEWLNIEHPKLNLVRHEDYIASEHLPVFSSHPIELNMHRIKGLSEHFVYFNDDIFIKAPIKKSQFFKNGLPRDSSVLNVSNGTGIAKIIINNIRIINEHFTKKEALRLKPFNWFNVKYGKQVFRSVLLLPWTKFTGFYDYHLPNAYLRSTLEEVWEKEFEKLNETSARKFRHDLDVNQYLFRYWQLSSNKFLPIAKHNLGDFYMVGKDSLSVIKDSIDSSKKPMICLNDHDPENLEYVIEVLKYSFEKKFPKKSSFEI